VVRKHVKLQEGPWSRHGCCDHFSKQIVCLEGRRGSRYTVVLGSLNSKGLRIFTPQAGRGESEGRVFKTEAAPFQNLYVL
jgi:hypothetical protein